MIWKFIREIFWAVIFWMMFLYVLPGWGRPFSLKSEAYVSSNVVRLSDILADSKELSNNFADVVLFYSPAVGDVLRISAEELKRILLRRGVNIDLEGEVKIYRRDCRISKEEFSSWLKKTLSKLGYCLDQHFNTDFIIPENAEKHISLPSICSGSCYAYVVVTAENYHRKIPVRVRPKVKLYIWRAKKNILPGEIFSDSNVELVETEKVPQGALSYNVSPKGFMARHPIKEGSVISRFDIKRVYLIKRGDKVRLLYNKNGIRVEVIGIAGRNGRVGDLIPVKNLASGREVFGKVRDREVVEVEL